MDMVGAMMKIPNTKRIVEIKIPSEFGYERVAREAVAVVAQGMGFDEERIEDIKFAIGEACVNAIEHGNKADVRKKVVVVFSADETKLDIIVKDSGEGGKPPLKVQTPDIHKKVAGLESPRQWGIYIIEQLVDEVGFEEADDGNQFHMVIYRVSDEEAEG
jgi:serine/threonine-protein kinase RsbW